ncbi:hypothetical protein BGZ60DRAFT_410647 [Tricladium varicosporioides]|nr:hypothetical protein BGZ60DRAFT_410647 [Hymenoscyphus varicosporioides]
MMEVVDLLIIGAGWHGLAMAKTYLESNPSTKPKITILDYADSIGGTWAKERLYPGLKTNNVVGTFEFSDFPLDTKKYGLHPGDHIPGNVVHEYLLEFAECYGISSLIRYRTKVHATTLLKDSTWRVEYSLTGLYDNEDLAARSQIIASKLVIATGLTSQPYIPNFPGQEKFTGTLLHSKDLKPRATDLANSRTLGVIGGNKSAWDVCYNAAISGAQAHMLIRPSGGGPSWVWRPLKFGSFTKSISSLSLMRCLTWLDPNPFGKTWQFIRKILHRTWLGRIICSFFWRRLDYYAAKANGYADSDRVGMLRPWSSTFWMGNSLSVHNYETEWFDLVKSGKIVVHHAEVSGLMENEVHLSNGETLKADTLVCCTGWQSVPTIKFDPPDLAAQIGLPQGKSNLENLKDLGDGEAVLEEEYMLTLSSQRKVFENAPVLREKPGRTGPMISKNFRIESNSIREKEDGIKSPYRLYKFMVPPSERFLEMRNLAFIGTHLSIHAIMLAQAQALWITAFFQHKLLNDDLDKKSVLEETYYHTEFERIRRPPEAGGSGGRFPDLVFDSLPYVDMLLGDIGMNTRRKSSWWRDISQSYTLRDYRGIVQEWLKTCSRRDEQRCLKENDKDLLYA